MVRLAISEEFGKSDLHENMDIQAVEIRLFFAYDECAQSAQTPAMLHLHMAHPGLSGHRMQPLSPAFAVDRSRGTEVHVCATRLHGDFVHAGAQG